MWVFKGAAGCSCVVLCCRLLGEFNATAGSGPWPMADLVKASNTLPRHPVFTFLWVVGVPVWFLTLWTNRLESFTRYLVLHRSAGQPIGSSTGCPEGCPLSCVAMTILDLLWHRWQSIPVPRRVPSSFVDNLELLCNFPLGGLAPEMERKSRSTGRAANLSRPPYFDRI